MPSTSRTARAASAASTARAPTVVRSSDRSGPLTNYAELRAALGEPVLDPELLERALTHRSYAYENGGLPTNERLEFLGDSVLGLVVTDTLYRTHPDLPEGQLAKLRAAVVNSRALAEVARGLELGRFIRLGRGEEGTGGRDKASILADTLEAVIGAVYLDGGWSAARPLVVGLVEPRLAALPGGRGDLDHKSMLQELASRELRAKTEYVVDQHGPEHDKTFDAVVLLDGRRLGAGSCRSKKQAEQLAARAALQVLQRPEYLRAEVPWDVSASSYPADLRPLPHSDPWQPDRCGSSRYLLWGRSLVRFV